MACGLVTGCNLFWKNKPNNDPAPAITQSPSNQAPKTKAEVNIPKDAQFVSHKISASKDLGDLIRMGTVNAEYLDLPKVVKAQVVEVADGDTFLITNPTINTPLSTTSSKKGDLIYTLKVRMLYSDTPETVKPKTPEQCYGKIASEYAKSQLNGKDVYLTFDKGPVDVKYQRILAFVFESKSDEEQFAKSQSETTLMKSLNFKLVQDGKGRVTAYSPNTTFKKLFTTAQDKAKADKKAVWTCPKPFEK
ncbi:MAG: thermonuclease family protein [Patescibacteria group bacterium]